MTQIACRVGKEVIHTFLSEIGIQRLEAILTRAKDNRSVTGSNDYLSLASVWAKERLPMAPDFTIKTPNPYRVGSKLFDIFVILSDGEAHTLVDLTHRVYVAGSGNNPIYRRRVASAIRTIRRRRCGVDVGFDGFAYRMVA